MGRIKLSNITKMYQHSIFDLTNILYAGILAISAYRMSSEGAYVYQTIVTLLVVFAGIQKCMHYSYDFTKFVILCITFQFTGHLYLTDLFPFLSIMDITITLPSFFSIILLNNLLFSLKDWSSLALLLRQQMFFFKSITIFAGAYLVFSAFLLLFGYFSQDSFSLAGKLIQYTVLLIWVLSAKPKTKVNDLSRI